MKILNTILLLFFTIILFSQSGNFQANDEFAVKNVYYFSPTFPSSTGWIDIYKDDGNKYSNTPNFTHAYENFGATKKPVGYVSGNVMVVGADLEIALCNSSINLDDIIIKGMAENGFEFAPQAAEVLPSDIIRYKKYHSSLQFTADLVQYFENFKIKWYITTDQAALDPNAAGPISWAFAGESENQVYITHKTPMLTLAPSHAEVTIPYHTVLHIGCVNGNGENNSVPIFDAIYKEFEDNQVYRVDGEGPLTYWGNFNPLLLNGECRTVGGLIEELDAACGEWSQFLEDIIRVQGISGSNIVTVDWEYILAQPDLTRMVSEVNTHFGQEAVSITIWPYSNNQGQVIGAYSGFLVNNWNNLSNAENFVLSEFDNEQTEITLANGNKIKLKEANGAAGQGNSNPRSEFENHAILGYNGNLYDPSYGTMKQNDALSWEATSLAAFGSRVIFQQVINGIPTARIINWVGYLNDINALQATYN